MNSSFRLILSLAAPFSLLLASGVSCSRAPQATKKTAPDAAVERIEVMQVQSSPLNREAELPASIESEHRTELFPRIEGLVSKVYVKIGDRVKENQLLILLHAPGVVDQVRHREELIKEAAAEIKRREAGIKLTEAEVNARQAALKIQTIKKDRMAILVKKGSLNQQRLDEAVFEVRSAEADLQHAHAEVEAAQAELYVAKAKKDVAYADLEATKTIANYREIRAPFDGLVTARNVDPGDFVKPHTHESGKGLLDLVRYDQVRAVIYIPLDQAAYVSSGDLVILRHHSHTGQDRIDSIAGEPLAISRAAHAFNKGSRMMRAEIDINNNDLEKETGELLIPGDYGKVWLTLEPLEGKPMVPRRAIVSSADGEMYLVILNTQHTPQKFPINRILLEDQGRAVIEAPGIAIGQRIIVNPTEDILIGQPINPDQLEEISDSK